MDPLVLIKKEDGEGGGIDELLDLVFTEITEESGFLVQAVGLIDDEPLERVGWGFREISRANK